MLGVHEYHGTITSRACRTFSKRGMLAIKGERMARLIGESRSAAEKRADEIKHQSDRERVALRAAIERLRSHYQERRTR